MGVEVGIRVLPPFGWLLVSSLPDPSGRDCHRGKVKGDLPMNLFLPFLASIKDRCRDR
jgi:hypothetical protein